VNFIRRGLRTSLAALIVLAALPAASMAGTASTVVDGQKRWVVYEAGAGEANDLLVQVSRQSRTVRLMDDGAAIVAGAGCRSEPPSWVYCSLDGQRVRLVQVDLEDGDDKADAETVTADAAQVNVVGGFGDDVLRGHGPSRFNFGGNSGDDVLVGSEGPDILRGQAGMDLMTGRGGDDLMIGDEGRDVLRAGLGRDRLFGGVDGDKLDARDGAQDAVVSCGDGTDLTTVDRLDRVKTVGCEQIKG
jgi:hypothetical protein